MGFCVENQAPNDPANAFKTSCLTHPHSRALCLFLTSFAHLRETVVHLTDAVNLARMV